jgi:hypothetical protein
MYSKHPLRVRGLRAITYNSRRASAKALTPRSHVRFVIASEEMETFADRIFHAARRNVSYTGALRSIGLER